MGLFSLESRRFRKHLLMGGSKEQGARLLSEAPSDGTSDNGHKPNLVKCFFLSFFFFCRADQTLEEVAQRCCGASRLGDIKNLNGHSCEQPALGDLALRLDEMISRGAFLHQPCCDSAIVR